MDRHRHRHPTGIRALALGVAANADRARAEADSRVTGAQVTCVGTPEQCAEEILGLLAHDAVDEVVITEQSADPRDHRDALREIARLVGAALPAPLPLAAPSAVPVG